MLLDALKQAWRSGSGKESAPDTSHSQPQPTPMDTHQRKDDPMKELVQRLSRLYYSLEQIDALSEKASAIGGSGPDDYESAHYSLSFKGIEKKAKQEARHKDSLAGSSARELMRETDMLFHTHAVSLTAAEFRALLGAYRDSLAKQIAEVETAVREQ